MTAITAPTGTPTFLTTTGEVARRAWWQMARSPQIIGIAVLQSVLFLLMFRYVIGGAIGVEGVAYVDFLVPGFVVSGLLFTAGGSAVAVAEDASGGVHDRLRSLPVSDLAVLTGRALADMGLMMVVAAVTTVVGVVVGFRPDATAADLLLAAVLVPLFAFAVAWVFQFIGLVAGNAQAAQGLGIIGVPFSFLSSAFVPVDTMPAAIEWFARYQPLSFWVDAVRGLTLGDPAIAAGGQSLATEVVGAVAWAIGLVVVFAALAVRRYRSR
jgi:ABC transporter DrrB family efflux protein